jgi:hypothetical protein
MSRGPGRLERAISLSISRHEASVAGGRSEAPWTLSSWTLVWDAYHSRDGGHSFGWTPTRAQRGMVVRAMRRFVQRHPRYGLMGGEGRRPLWLFDTTDPRSRQWLEVRFRKGGFVSWSDAKRAIITEGGAA